MKTRKKQLALTTGLFLSFLEGISACAACMSQASGAMKDGLSSAVFLLLGVVAVVLFGFGCFFIYLRKRSREVGYATAGENNNSG